VQVGSLILGDTCGYNMVSSTVINKHVLLVEDSTALAATYQVYLRKSGYDVTHLVSGEECLEFVESKLPDLLLLDIGLPDISGLEVLQKVRERHPGLNVVMITGNASLVSAVDAMKMGAYDYIVKPVSLEKLGAVLRPALNGQVPEEQKKQKQHVVDVAGDFQMIGNSAAIQQVRKIIDSAAPSRATVFITGESGTGKELCAAAIHAKSDRGSKAFVPLNCAAIPRELMESVIFGHVKGAFSGAVSDREGAAIAANGGTLFLDEICEMDVELQAKLLRMLQSKSVQRVGSNKIEPIDLRVVCATNRDPHVEVKARRFREDLFYRLHVISIHLPPLKARSGDIKLLADDLLLSISREESKHFSSFSKEAYDHLEAHSWPGNIRELQNVIRKVVVLFNGKTVELPMLHVTMGTNWPDAKHVQIQTSSLTEFAAAAPDLPQPNIRPLWQVEQDEIAKALQACKGNVARAAAFLEIGASTLYRKKAEFEAKQQHGDILS
jgi:two-component system, repressor protein LuxO